MKKHYETLFVLKPTLTDEEIQKQIEAVVNVITANGGEIAAVDKVGMRDLAYEVQKNKRGYYTIIYYTAPTSAIKEIERNLRINEDVIRFITVKYENKKEQKIWETQASKVK
ncbi:MAG: 30S ribosomal protein S6 [Epsilonproteobacteria bacterium]|nr:30S ribosomal protein S6 [Campylobacterota bacterium]